MIFTFYSYKGGVGRSMAMAGIAHLLARRGLRVLAIDFDLEAPGLERYFFDGERCKAVRAQRGLLDLIQAYRLALSSESAFAQAEFKRWEQFRLTAIHVAGSLGGSVDLMTAGCREPEAQMHAYALAVRSFDWQDFFHNWKGDLFFDWLRRTLREPPAGYDVVLVDSRTGVTEMGGVCAYQLADVAVLLCAPNYQNLEGTRDVARDFRSESVRGLRQGRPLEIVAVPARLEPEHPRRAEFLARFKEELGVEGLPAALAAAGLDYEKLALPYLPQFAVAERLVGDPQAERGQAAPPIEVFERLADALTLLADPATPLGRQREAALDRLTGGSAVQAIELLADATLSSAGYDAFIDYSRDDYEIVMALHTALEHGGFRVFRDIGRVEEGAAWQPALEQALGYSHTLLVCFGQPTDTELRARTLAHARRLQTVHIVPVLLPGADPAALASFDLAMTQALDLREWPETAARERLLAAVGAGARSAPPESAALPDRDPYPGGRPYGEDDAAFFFGRDEELALLCDTLTRSDVVLLSGPAQVGKTSLLRAGLLPAMRPGGARAKQLALRELAWIDLADEAEPPWTDWIAWLARRQATSPQVDLLVLDSVDSFVHDGRAPARSARLARIGDLLAAAGAGCKLVLVARDVLPEAERRAAFDALERLRFAQLQLAPLAGAALQRAIVEPARRAGHLLEPGLSERLLESAGSARSAIMQIQLALAAVWPERRRGWLTNKSLDAVGHLGGVVQRQRVAMLATLGRESRAAVRTLFSRLVTLSSRYELVSAPQPWEPLASIPLLERVDVVALRDRLAGAGLIDLYLGSAADTRPDAPVREVQVALTRPDPAAYFGEGGAAVDLRFLLWRDALAPQARRWLAGSSDATLRGAALVEAQEGLEQRGDELTRTERNFITASTKAEERQRELVQRRQDAEHAAREAQERERREAAEAMAAERGARLEIEQAATQRAKLDAAQLTRSNRWMRASLLAGGVLLAVALAQTWNERSARRAAVENAARADDEAQRARSEAKLADEEYQRSKAAKAAAEEALRAALLATQATEKALAARTDAGRDQANALLREAKTQVRNAGTDVQKLQGECPVGRRVYLHIARETERAAARAVIPQLQKQGYVVPGIELVKQAPPGTDVRYFRAADAAGAAPAAKVLAGMGIRDAAPKLIAGYENSPTIRPCHYEIWFAAGALDSSGASAKN